MNYCDQCGSKLDPETKKCPNCDQVETTSQIPKEDKSFFKKNFIWITLAAVLVVGLVAIFFLGFPNRSKIAGEWTPMDADVEMSGDDKLIIDGNNKLTLSLFIDDENLNFAFDLLEQNDEYIADKDTLLLTGNVAPGAFLHSLLGTSYFAESADNLNDALEDEFVLMFASEFNLAPNQMTELEKDFAPVSKAFQNIVSFDDKYAQLNYSNQLKNKLVEAEREFFDKYNYSNYNDGLSAAVIETFGELLDSMQIKIIPVDDDSIRVIFDAWDNEGYLFKRASR